MEEEAEVEELKGIIKETVEGTSDKHILRLIILYSQKLNSREKERERP